MGVNRFVEEEPEPSPFTVDPAIEREQVERLRALRARRDAGRVRGALDAVREAARRDPPDPAANLVPPILEAVRSLATIGEISDALREVFGTYEERA